LKELKKIEESNFTGMEYAPDEVARFT